MILIFILVAAVVSCLLLGCAIWTLPVHLKKSGGQQLIEEACPPPAIAAFSASYAFGSHSIGKILCQFDVIFQTALQDPVKDFTNIFFWGGPAVLFVLLLESSRIGRPYASSIPLVFGLLTQTITGAIAGILFWGLFLVQACYPGSRRGTAPVSYRDVEAAFLAVLIGYCIPTAWMVLAKTSLAIVLWHPFPVYISIIQNSWILYRGETNSNIPGFGPAQRALLLFSIIGTASYYYNVIPHLSLSAFTDFYHWIPSWKIPNPRTTTYPSVVLQFLQYDALWMFGATFNAAFFLLEIDEDFHIEKIVDIIYVMLVTPILVLLLGPAAVVGGHWVNRELCLGERALKAASKKPKTR